MGTVPKLAANANRTEAVCLCDETNEEAGPETEKDRAATFPSHPRRATSRTRRRC